MNAPANGTSRETVMPNAYNSVVSGKWRKKIIVFIRPDDLQFKTYFILRKGRNYTVLENKKKL